ncbi:hypothetical protein G1K57_12290 [Tenacibaculum finnmarkense]|uniref:hypothetical protein n=1 Tax=Tenacibaculum finnmarkense TaxID=2781243 RepID=UPI001EFA6DE6|nr:hypothetical protein [Tenacibaculum finnmarkense]MCG8808913.1 hypothetical protein [Tenacibaculum finnmarkense]MCG8819155.1 hypothetical protein [Tenacibaculum finnmarkense]
MRKITILLFAIALTSCGAAMRTMSGATINTLKKQVSIEQGCAIEKIELLEKQQAAGNATYALNVCEKRMVYKQIGSVFMEAAKADKMMGN